MADQLAGERGWRPVTDETVDHVAIGGLSMDRLGQALLATELVKAPSEREIESIAAFIAIKTVVPRDISTIPAQRIMEFREKHLGGRGAFQAHLSGFLEQRRWLSDIKDRRDLHARLEQELTKNLEPQLAELRSKLSGDRIDTATGVITLQVGAPLFITNLADFAGVVANPVATYVAGGALALAKVLRDREKARNDALKSSPASYLLTMEQDLEPKSVLGGITDAVRRFFTS
jgi:hypothetical protein